MKSGAGLVRCLARKLALAAFGPLAAPAALADVPVREQYAYSIPLKVPAHASLARVDVPFSVYRDAVLPGLRDLRVLNGAGEEVPFALEPPAAAVRAMPTTMGLPLFPLRGEAAVSGAALELRIDGGKTSIQLEGGQPAADAAPLSGYLVVTENLGQPVDALIFRWPEDAADFALNLEIAVSEDLARWSVVVPRGPVARLRHSNQVFEQNEVALPATRARFLRIRAEGSATLPPLESVFARLVMTSVPLERVRQQAPGRAVPGAPGVYEFDLGAQLPVDRVTLALPEVNTVTHVSYMRRRDAGVPWRLATAGTVHRMRSAHGELVSQPLPVPAEAARYWRVEVDPRGGGIGSGMPTLIAGWLPDRLVFVTRGSGPFEIVYGKADAQEAEVPLERLLTATGGSATEVELEHLLAAQAGEPREAGGAERLMPVKPSRPWRIWALWFALLAGVGTLAALAWSLARQMRAAGH